MCVCVCVREGVHVCGVYAYVCVREGVHVCGVCVCVCVCIIAFLWW